MAVSGKKGKCHSFWFIKLTFVWSKRTGILESIKTHSYRIEQRFADPQKHTVTELLNSKKQCYFNRSTSNKQKLLNRQNVAEICLFLFYAFGKSAHET